MCQCRSVTFSKSAISDGFPVDDDVSDVRPVLPETRAVLHQLPHHPDHALAEEQRRGAGLQCLRSLLQAARGQQADGHEERWHSDQKEETQAAAAEEQGGHQN